MILQIGKREFRFGQDRRPGGGISPMSRSRYDAAQTNHTNRRHWQNADNLSSDQANSPGVRKTLRERARYEIANDTYIGGMVETFADEVVGTGPRMEFLDKSATTNIQVMNAWNQWFEEIDGAEKVRMAFLTAVGDGESFMLEAPGKNQFSPVQLDYILLDAERCTNSLTGFGTIDPLNIDGVMLDEAGRPISYTFLENHPGAGSNFSSSFGKTRVLPASGVIHFFKSKRPEQHRGVPEITAALPLGSKGRAFTLSTLDAARIASTFSGVMHTNQTSFGDGLSTGGANSDGSFTPFQEFALENGMFMMLPKGYDMKQVKAEHPTTTYNDFKKALIAEEARALGMPYNVAAADSSGHNFASANLDIGKWLKVVVIRQKRVERKILFKMFMTWWETAILIEGLLPRKVRRIGYIPQFKWFFDGSTAIDPLKKAKANETKLKNKSTNLARVYAEEGLNWEEEVKQIAKEKDTLEKLGLTSSQEEEPLEQINPDDLEATVVDAVFEAIDERSTS